MYIRTTLVIDNNVLATGLEELHSTSVEIDQLSQQKLDEMERVLCQKDNQLRDLIVER